MECFKGIYAQRSRKQPAVTRVHVSTFSLFPPPTWCMTLAFYRAEGSAFPLLVDRRFRRSKTEQMKTKYRHPASCAAAAAAAAVASSCRYVVRVADAVHSTIADFACYRCRLCSSKLHATTARSSSSSRMACSPY